MAIAPIMSVAIASAGFGQVEAVKMPQAASPSGGSFTDLFVKGLETVDTKVAKADELMKAYALGEAIPVHQVTIALEEARLAVELSVQIRERLTETYRSFMNMQL